MVYFVAQVIKNNLIYFKLMKNKEKLFKGLEIRQTVYKAVPTLKIIGLMAVVFIVLVILNQAGCIHACKTQGL